MVKASYILFPNLQNFGIIVKMKEVDKNESNGMGSMASTSEISRKLRI